MRLVLKLGSILQSDRKIVVSRGGAKGCPSPPESGFRICANPTHILTPKHLRMSMADRHPGGGPGRRERRQLRPRLRGPALRRRRVPAASRAIHLPLQARPAASLPGPARGLPPAARHASREHEQQQQCRAVAADDELAAAGRARAQLHRDRELSALRRRRYHEEVSWLIQFGFDFNFCFLRQYPIFA